MNYYHVLSPRIVPKVTMSKSSSKVVLAMMMMKEWAIFHHPLTLVVMWEKRCVCVSRLCKHTHTHLV